MKKVVHFHRKPYPGAFSIEGLFSAIRETLLDLGCEVELAVAPCSSRGLFDRLSNLLWARKQRGEVNHITGDINYLTLVLPRSRTVLTIHDLNTLHRLRGVKRWIYKTLWFSLPIRYSSITTVISNETKRAVLAEFTLEEQRIVVIPNAVSPTYKPCPKDFNAERPRILQIGTKRNKNLLRLVAALEGIKCHLHIIGTPDDEATAAISKSGITCTLDSNLTEEEMCDAYREADIVSFVSTAEGFGMPIIESQYIERPVVTSNVSSMPEIAGNGACLVNPYDVADIRRGFLRVVRDEAYRKQLIEAGRHNRKNFDLETVAKLYLQLYERISTDVKDRIA